MKAKELMIGDWVNIIPEEYRNENYNIQIDRIQPMMSNRLRVGAGKYYSHIDLITPIPLTEEILKANGFQKTKYYYEFITNIDVLHDAVFIEKDSPCNYGLVIDTEINMEGECSYHYELPDVKYVHELQHALRLCGLNDLADNFKVNE